MLIPQYKTEGWNVFTKFLTIFILVSETMFWNTPPQIDPSFTPSGELFSLAPLDREQESQHPLVVKATDGGGRSCHADVLLLVQDANDNSPHFSTGILRVTIFDNTTVHTPVAVLTASDPDTGEKSCFFGFFSNSFCGTVKISTVGLHL